MQVLALESKAGNILVPVSMVAQIVSRSLMKPFQCHVDFVSSSINWRDIEIPLVYSSEMLGAESSSDAEFERAVVLWPMKGGQAADLFALTSIGSPHVVTIDADIKRMGDNGSSVVSKESAREYVLDYLEVEGRPAMIPDLRLISNVIFET
jgi:hypothetical protein